MAERHLSDDDLIARLYGVGPSDGHLEQCEECAERWRLLVQERREALQPAEVSEELLAAQRRAIYARLDQPRSSWWRPRLAVPAAAAAMILAVLLVSRPAPAPQPSLAVSDVPKETELFSDIYTTVQSTEPLAVAPIRSLFEENQ